MKSVNNYLLWLLIHLACPSLIFLLYIPRADSWDKTPKGTPIWKHDLDNLRSFAIIFDLPVFSSARALLKDMDGQMKKNKNKTRPLFAIFIAM